MFYVCFGLNCFSLLDNILNYAPAYNLHRFTCTILFLKTTEWKINAWCYGRAKLKAIRSSCITGFVEQSYGWFCLHPLLFYFLLFWYFTYMSSNFAMSVISLWRISWFWYFIVPNCKFVVQWQNGLDTKVEKSRKQLKERKNRAKKIRGVKKV